MFIGKIIEFIFYFSVIYLIERFDLYILFEVFYNISLI